MGKKVGAYIRVSTEEQAKEGISISAQIQRCTDFCKARGWEMPKLYTDAGLSAGSMKRQALQQLLDDAKAKKFEILLVYKIDRFSRNLKDLIFILEDLKKQGINFTSVTEQIDTTTAMGEAFFQIIGVFAQLERGMVKERVKMAFDKKISSGEILNRPPFGYKYKNRKLVISKEESIKVKEIFEMWIAGVHYKEIAANFQIPVSTLYEIIKNPTYLGKVKYKGRLFNGIHKPIINKDIFKAIQEKLKK
ncbi:MAG: recombinase family protein [Nanoarchaeota archaeon]|nr:recombinase family protein [Nanoarchaeota archaeon]